MKIKEMTFNYELEANNQIAHFKNRLIKSFWDNVNFKVPQEEYYKINREISDTVDELVGIISCEYHVDRRASRQMPEGYLEDMVISTMVNSIAHEIKKTDVAYIGVSSNLYADKTYKVSIPFIKTVLK